jgi:hypothetical protein
VGKVERILMMLSMVLILLLVPSTRVNAAPYVAGYLRGNVVTTTKVLGAFSYGDFDLGSVPSGEFLAGVTRVAGANGLTPSGWVYQNGIALFNTGEVWWPPQEYYGDTPGPYHVWPVPVGDNTYAAFYVRMSTDGGTVTNELWAYPTVQDLLDDNPVHYQWSLPAHEANFLVGRQKPGLFAPYIKHFQVGVESNVAITETDWSVDCFEPCWYDGAHWRYYPGYACRGTSSHITWIGWTQYCVGGEVYTGVDKTSSDVDAVGWEYTGTTVGDDALLWSESGTVSDIVSKPYAVPPSGGGCPFLQVWDGSNWVDEGLLDIHSAEGVDVTYEHTLTTVPEPVNGAYAFRLTEHPKTISDIDQVQLHAILEDGTVKKLPLISAQHSEEDNVLSLLLRSDDRRAQEKGADHNGGISQSIDLKFAALGHDAETVAFIFAIEGYNMICKTCD